jgi:hypothetical protein
MNEQQLRQLLIKLSQTFDFEIEHYKELEVLDSDRIYENLKVQLTQDQIMVLIETLIKFLNNS